MAGQRQFVDSVAPAARRSAERGAPERLAERTTERREERRLERPGSGVLTNDGRFSLDESLIPPGFKMEWKRHTLMGQNDRRNQVIVRQFHWQPVPHKMQPHIYGHTCTNDEEHVIVDGLGLYMRPDYLCEEAEAENLRETDYVTNQQLQSLRLSSKEQVGDRYTKIKKTTVAVPQSVD